MAAGEFWIDEAEKELVLVDQDQESRFVIEDDLVVDGVKYLIIIAADAAEDEAATVVKISHDNGEEIIIPVEAEAEFNKVQQAYLDA
ncbi:DUF1292 domain-containing protein [Halanaerobium salsuginis]|jgi:hypothetical protein|uniref:DUF1292 domain-containing protein n=1 Tax=Halanaerobium salsuginis TaxID=29563 RepID=A0A1I4ETQ9_9FIRM|nr:DUF1292 domain-containing protein [Halanaerobium salsuginis]SFL07927.1 Protein of unknown function [Halanaerobium salsuginis]